MVDPAPKENESIDALIEQLRQRVAKRREAGEYRDGLVEGLDAHFEHIAAHRVPAFDYDGLRDRLRALDAAGSFDPGEISYDTRMPGGSYVHRLLAKLVRRQTEGILAQAQRHADAVREVLWEVVTALETPAAHTHTELAGEIEALFSKLSQYERTRTDASDAALLRRVEALEAKAVDGFEPWFASDRFEARFRGASDELKERYRDLAATFAGVHGPVVDVGCGRGEFLELLLEEGVDARGIELDADLVRGCVARGLPVDYGEAISWLGTVREGSIGGLALIQVVEHLAPQALTDFVELAAHKVRRGGKVVCETVNPQSLYTFAHAFYLDPAHKAPVHPAYLRFLFQEAGFSQVDLEWRSPCPPDDRLRPLDEDDPDTRAVAKQVNANNERVNQLLFAEQDYALIAVR